MRPLVAVRQRSPFDPGFLRRGSLFWPLERAAGALPPTADFPPIESLTGVFEGKPPVRFVPARPRRRGALDVRALYDSRIALDGEVPTRPRCWHDFLNALVWGTFPRAKRALHVRQHRALTAQIALHAGVLPPSRTPELDALALLDEGGVIVCDAAEPVRDRPGGPNGNPGPGDIVLFGHALYESLVLGVSPAVVAALALPISPPPRRGPTPAFLRTVDEVLSRTLEDDALLQSPHELARLRLPAAAAVRPSSAALR